jgi:hypothetical protein
LASRSNLREAKKRLMETHPSSKVELTNWDHSHLKFLIATLNRFSPKKPNTHLPISNRSYCRLEFNISPTKQRTEVLSNRP